MTLKRAQSILIITTLLFCAVIWIAHLVIKNSEPYKIANSFVVENVIIQNKLGKIRNIGLALFGSSLTYSQNCGKATLKMTVVGAQASGRAEFYFEKREKTWVMRQADLITDSTRTSLLAT